MLGSILAIYHMASTLRFSMCHKILGLVIEFVTMAPIPKFESLLMLMFLRVSSAMAPITKFESLLKLLFLKVSICKGYTIEEG